MAQAAAAPLGRLVLIARWVTVLIMVAVIAGAVVMKDRWLSPLRAWMSPPPAESHDEHAGHDHAAHAEVDAIELSDQARKNIGLQVGKVALQPFTRTISLPGIVVERPGRSTIDVTTPMTGIVTRIYPIQGEAVEPGEKLFELRLTHEEIVQAQAELLRSAEELDVLSREIDRLEKVSLDGAIAGKQLLERKYEQQKLQAISRAQEQALLLHGLLPEQVAAILKDRSLLQKITVFAPLVEMGEDGTHAAFQIQQLKISPGQHVEAGASLAVLANYAELFIEGSAFERDATDVNRAVKQSLPVTALVDGEGAPMNKVEGLKILYLSAKVDADSRSLHFYVVLPNEREQEAIIEGERSFFSWRYRPGQRMQLLVPVEVLPERIVLPVDAIAQDGAETYVFVPNGKQFNRRPVHVEYRDSQWAVIANDGALFPGDNVAISGAQQLQLALENKSGGAIDPHAGHNH